MLAARALFALIVTVILCRPAWIQSQACKDRAALPPLATFGGPATASPGHTELGLGFGAFGEGLYGTCAITTDMAGAEDWLVRWRRGMTSRTDLGFDLLFSNDSSGNQEATIKVATRYQAKQGLRLEAGVGTADGGIGRAVNADLAAVIGTYKRPTDTWNYYASLRFAASHGCFNLLCVGGQGAPGTRSSGALLPLGVIGATARVSDATRFVMECGLGETFSREAPSSNVYIHLSFGVQFNVGKDRKREAHRVP
jgi:hypothetical protein